MANKSLISLSDSIKSFQLTISAAYTTSLGLRATERIHPSRQPRVCLGHTSSLVLAYKRVLHAPPSVHHTKR